MLEGFHDVLFPLTVSHGARGGPVWRTDIVGLSNGHERRAARWARPRRRYDAAYGLRSREDVRAVLSFFEAREGRRHAFRWRDPLDHSSAPSGDPGPTDQPLGTGNGTQTVFPLVTGSGGASRPVLLPVVGTVRVGLDGEEMAPGDGWSLLDGQVVFALPPAVGVAVTAGFLFDVPVRFDTDQLSISVEPGGGGLPSIPIVEVLS